MADSSTKLELSELFNRSRFKPSIFNLFLVFYAPLGIFLALVRLFIGIHCIIISSILPYGIFRRIILRCMCIVLGVIIVEKGSQNKPRKSAIITSVSVSTFDHLALKLSLDCVVPCVWHLQAPLLWLFGYVDFGVDVGGKDTLIKACRNHLTSSKLPLLAFPEGAQTNGERGLLHFSTWPFSLASNSKPIHPVAIRISRFPLAVCPSHLNSTWSSDLLWTLLLPYTVYSLDYLTPVRPEPDESNDQMAKRVQSLLAARMGVVPTSYTAKERAELRNRLAVPSKTADSRLGSREGLTERQNLTVTERRAATSNGASVLKVEPTFVATSTAVDDCIKLNGGTSPTSDSPNRPTNISVVEKSIDSDVTGEHAQDIDSSPDESPNYADDSSGDASMTQPEQIPPDNIDLVAQVEAVLPDTSREIIQSALDTSDGDIDRAILLIMSGDVTTPDRSESSAEPIDSAANDHYASLKMASESFGSDSNSRQQDLALRKRRLLDAVRDRYRDKLLLAPAGDHGS